MDWYPHQNIEKKWRERWQRARAGRSVDFSKKEKFYVLFEFPYPSGDGLHVGHARPYSAMDAVVRKLRMQGKNVLFPIGWDAFGLPTENYALKRKVHPRSATDANIATFKRQMQELGLSLDWAREIDTTDPAYYRWTQWLFNQFLKAGLAYQARMPINWCPKDKIGLANEEVVAGKCERCGAEVVRKMQRQWMLKITAYAERLLHGLDTVDYPEQVKAQQVNWIGKSEGAEIKFQVRRKNGEGRGEKGEKILVATNNPSKVERIRKLLKDIQPAIQIVTPKEEGLESIEAEEGSDLQSNAVAKANAYHGKTDLPILGTDTGIFIEGEDHDPAQVKRNALGGVDDPSMPQEEKAKRMIAFYTSIAKKHGGKAPGYWKDVFVLVMPDGTVQTSESRRDVVFTETVRKPVDEFFPMRSLYINNATGKYAADETEEEEIHVDLAPYRAALLELLRPTVTVFTTRPDTLFGATYLVLSPEHEAIQKGKFKIQNEEEVRRYIQRSAKKSDLDRTDLAKEKTGVQLEGVMAINPATNEPIPIWIADYVLSTYGTGAIMAVPAHDERDWEFAKKFDLQLKTVVLPSYFGSGAKAWMAKNKVISEKDILQVLKSSVEGRESVYSHRGSLQNSGEFNGLTSDEATVAITQWLEKKGLGKKNVQYKLRDWVFSRQHYWGEPIPVVHCPACKDRVVQTAFHLNFRDQETWQRLVTGLKKVETRALNPDEQERYFGTVQKGAFLACVNVQTNETTYFKVLNAHTFKNLEAFAKKPGLVQKMNLEVRGARTAKELEDGYRFTPDYLDRIKKNGLVAWEIERVIPGVVPVPDKELPVELPHVEAYEPTDTGESPLAAIPQFVNVTCPECGGEARRETDTMPNWAGSSWYYLRYTDPKNKKAFADPKKLAYWLKPDGVDLYEGGMEHTTLHLLYSRFWHKFLFDQGLVPTQEPYAKRRSHGIVLAEDGRKMSKSFGNVMNPDDIIREYGADTLRVYELFMGPFEEAIPWSTRSIVGVHRFLDRVWKVGTSIVERDDRRDVQGKSVLIHKTVKKVSEDIETFRFNTAVSTLMEYFNARDFAWKINNKGKAEGNDVDLGAFKKFLALLYPMAPHLSSELWEKLHPGKDIADEAWPTYDESKLKESVVTLIVQVNGKVRARMDMASGTTKDEALRAALEHPNVKKFVQNEPRQVVYVPEKLINIVV